MSKRNRFFLTFNEGSLYHKMTSKYGSLFTRAILDKFFEKFLNDSFFRDWITFGDSAVGLGNGAPFDSSLVKLDNGAPFDVIED